MVSDGNADDDYGLYALQTSMVTLNFRMLFLWNGAASRRDVRSISSNISAPRWNIVTA